MQEIDIDKSLGRLKEAFALLSPKITKKGDNVEIIQGSNKYTVPLARHKTTKAGTTK